MIFLADGELHNLNFKIKCQPVNIPLEHDLGFITEVHCSRDPLNTETSADIFPNLRAAYKGSVQPKRAVFDSLELN